jgi:hypothetical protein
MAKELFAVTKENHLGKNEIISNWMSWEKALRLVREYEKANPKDKDKFAIVPNAAWYKNLWR